MNEFVFTIFVSVVLILFILYMLKYPADLKNGAARMVSEKNDTETENIQYINRLTAFENDFFKSIFYRIAVIVAIAGIVATILINVNIRKTNNEVLSNKQAPSLSLS